MTPDDFVRPSTGARNRGGAASSRVMDLWFRSRSIIGLAAVSGIVALCAAGCGGGGYSSSTSTAKPRSPASVTTGGEGGGGPSAPVSVTQKDFAITPDKTAARAGEVKFSVKNDGPSVHEFVIFKTELAPDAMPVDENKVDEEAKEVDHIDEIENIGAGESKELIVKLDPGKYVLICNLPGHYGLGMRAGFEVS